VVLWSTYQVFLVTDLRTIVAGSEGEGQPGSSRDLPAEADDGSGGSEEEDGDEEEGGLLSPGGSIFSLRRQARAEGFAVTGNGYLIWGSRAVGGTGIRYRTVWSGSVGSSFIIHYNSPNSEYFWLKFWYVLGLVKR